MNENEEHMSTNLNVDRICTSPEFVCQQNLAHKVMQHGTTRDESVTLTWSQQMRENGNFAINLEINCNRSVLETPIETMGAFEPE